MSAFADLVAGLPVERLARVLLHSLWQGAASAAAAALLLTLTRQAAAVWRHAIAFAALLVLPVGAAATWWWLDAPPRSVLVAVAAAPARVAAPSDAGLPAARPLPPTDTASMPAWSWADAAVAAWVLGVLLLAGRHAWTWWRLRALRRQGLTPLPDHLAACYVRCRQRLGVGAACRAWLSDRVAVPLTFGIWRPLVLLPISLASKLSCDQVEALLLHELAHVRRRDFLVNLAQTAVETLFFYHPAAWWLGARVRAERECCCDDAVVAGGAAPRTLAEALAALAGAAPGLANAAAGGAVARRVARLVGTRTPARPGAAALAAALLAVALVAGLAACAGRAAQVEPLGVALGLPMTPVEAAAGRPARRLGYEQSQVNVTCRIISGSASQLRALGLPTNGDAVPLDARALAGVLANIETGGGVNLLQHPQITMYSRQRAHAALITQFSYLADHRIDGAGNPEPALVVANLGQTIDVRAHAEGTAVIIDLCRIEHATMPGSAVSSVEIATPAGIQRLPFEEPYVVVGRGIAAGVRLASGACLAIPLAFTVQRPVAQVRALALPGSMREERSTATGGISGPLVAVITAEAIEPRVDEAAYAGIDVTAGDSPLLKAPDGASGDALRARLSGRPAHRPADGSIAALLAWLRAAGLDVTIAGDVVTDGSDDLRITWPDRAVTVGEGLARLLLQGSFSASYVDHAVRLVPFGSTDFPAPALGIPEVASMQTTGPAHDGPSVAPSSR